MIQRFCQVSLALLCVSICLWAMLTHLYNERYGIPLSNGECPYIGKQPLQVTLSTYWISGFAMSIRRASSSGEDTNKIIWTPKEPMVFHNRKWKETVCLSDTLNDCYVFTIRDEDGGEGLTDGSCDLLWKGRLIKRFRGTFGESSSASFYFGDGCHAELQGEF